MRAHMVRPCFETCEAPCRPVTPNESSSVGEGGRRPSERRGRRNGKLPKPQVRETCGAHIYRQRGRGGTRTARPVQVWVGGETSGAYEPTARQRACSDPVRAMRNRRRRRCSLRARHGFERGRGSAIPAYNRTQHGCDCTNA
jgi:hypothetical protein